MNNQECKVRSEIVNVVKQIFISAVIFFSCNLPSVKLLKFISMSNQESKGRPEIVNVNSD